MRVPSSLVRIAAGAIIGVLLTTAWRSSPPAPAAVGPLVVGSVWHAPNGIEYRIEEAQGDWVRVTTSGLQPGFQPSAIWIVASTGAVWTRQ